MASDDHPRKKDTVPLEDESGKQELNRPDTGGAEVFVPGLAMASPTGSRIEITPRVRISEEYDDNVLMTKENKQADFRASLSPGIKVNAQWDRTALDLDYEFGWVKYHKRSQNDYVRHQGSLRFSREIARHVFFQLEDTYIKSDDILASQVLDPLSQRIIPGVLQTYQSNNARALVEYRFGPESRVAGGYVYNIMDNKDSRLQDTTEYGPFALFSYWFNKRNGLVFDYKHSRYKYTPKDTPGARPDLRRDTGAARYIHRFNPRTSAFVQYALVRNNFFDVAVTYMIHDGRVGIDHAFSPTTSGGLGGGYYRASGDTTIEPGYDFFARFGRTFDGGRGSLDLGVEHGFDQGYIEVVPRGFTRFWSGQVSVSYRPMEAMDVYAGLTYRKNEYQDDELDILGGQQPPDDETYQARCGINWRFYRWYAVGLTYTYMKRNSKDPLYDLDDNRIMLFLTVSKPFRY